MSPITCLMLLGASSAAFASETKEFRCSANLDYAITNADGVLENKTVELLLSGARTPRNTLSGGVYIQAGRMWSNLQLPQASLSDSLVMIKGKNNKDGVSLDFKFTANDNRTQNRANFVSLEVKTADGVVRASSVILDANSDGQVHHHPVFCDIE